MNRMKRLFLAAMMLFPVLLLAYWVVRGARYSETMSERPAEVKIEERLQQFGALVRSRLKLDFDKAQVAYPPAKLVFVGLKQEKTLEVYAADADQGLKFVRAYPILAASGGLGPKLREGDRQVPEGIYAIESLNPNSKYHLALRVNYPNAFDREQAKLEGRTDLGGDIMIHGGEASVGCLAMGDEAVEDLFVLAGEAGLSNITVILSPVDFRKGRAVKDAGAFPKWTEGLYQTIRSNLDRLPPGAP